MVSTLKEFIAEYRPKDNFVCLLEQIASNSQFIFVRQYDGDTPVLLGDIDHIFGTRYIELFYLKNLID